MMKCHGDHGSHGGHGAHGSSEMVAANMVKGGIISTGLHAGKSLLLNAGKHPLLLFTVGIALGVYLQKNRNEIIESAGQITEKGKDFISGKD